MTRTPLSRSLRNVLGLGLLSKLPLQRELMCCGVPFSFSTIMDNEYCITLRVVSPLELSGSIGLITLSDSNFEIRAPIRDLYSENIGDGNLSQHTLRPRHNRGILNTSRPFIEED
jgi:hypothetical protein